MEKKANNIVRIPTKLDINFFRYWLTFLTPFHKLTKREMDVATSFLWERFKLSKGIIDKDILDDVVMGDAIKHKIKKDNNLYTAHFQIILSKLKQNKFIIDNKINPRFIPKNLKEKDKAFSMLLYFDLD